MSQAKRQHPNAPLTPAGRLQMVRCVVERRSTVEATAERFQVDAKTVRQWRDRYLTEGRSGLFDRSSRPCSCPWATTPDKRREVLEIRRRNRWGAAHIAYEAGLAPSTVQAILTAAGVARLDRGDRVTLPIVRYERERPGELVHVDVDKLAMIPDGGGWRVNGWEGRVHNGEGGRPRLGYRYLHSAIDDRTRIVYSKIHDDEQAITAAAFWRRAAQFFAELVLGVERVITDNGSCYRSFAWRDACAATGTTPKRTRPYRPQTNGKIERFHRILLEEWAYLRPWRSERERTTAYRHFCHFYNYVGDPVKDRCHDASSESRESSPSKTF
ncbi:MAG: IS481 family transposase [Acidimicrobiales bacterium]